VVASDLLAHDAQQVRFRGRMIVAGVAVSYAMCLALAAWIAATPGHAHRTAMAAMVALGAAIATVVAILPAERILRSRWREAFFLAWSLSYVGVITAIAAVDGGPHSPVVLVYFITLVYAALAYPLASVVVVSAASVVAFAGLALLVPTPAGAIANDAGYLWVFSTALATAGVMCAWQAQIQSSQRDELERLSRSDGLTGCLNRLGFDERFAQELRRAERATDVVGIVTMDLEGFKAINDRHGHEAGDELLRWTAAAAGGLLREGDALGRLGGDEFALLLRGADADAAEGAAERLRAALGERVRATTGVAAFPEHGRGHDELLRHADTDLYRRRARRLTPATWPPGAPATVPPPPAG
jgi:diguanylate cyclase (GGDEF)-like protein